MIFLTSKPADLMLMLCDADLAKMREGHTLFVDDRATKGHRFTRVVLSLHKTDQEAIDLIKQAGKMPVQQALATHQAKLGIEATCARCQGIMPPESLYKGKCIVCWSVLATTPKETLS